MEKKDTGHRPANYRKLFFLGVFCMAIGLPFGVFILIVLGTFLMIVGWMNKHKWPKVETVEIAGLAKQAPAAKKQADDYDR